jgi:hypothetical protein
MGYISLEWAKDKQVGMLSAITVIIIIKVAVINICGKKD